MYATVQVAVLKNASIGPDSCRVWNGTGPPEDNSSIPCTKFVFDNSEWKKTIINQGRGRISF